MGASYQFAMDTWAYGPATSVTANMQVDWYDSGNAYLGYTTGPDVPEMNPAGLLFRLEAGAGVHPKGERLFNTLQNPGVAFFERLHPGGPIPELLWHPCGP